MKVIGIVGSRRRKSLADVQRLLKAFDELYEEGDTIVSGGCPEGADAFAEHIAKQRGVPITIYPARWSDSKHAGLERNTKIAEACDVLIALVHEDRTGGTEDTVKKTLALGKKVIYV